jgi:uncharacterized damage-inducible protein DinB
MSETKHIELVTPGGIHPRLAFLFAQMEDVRKHFKSKAEGLSVEELDQQVVEGFLRPGQLLAHSAGAEEWWIKRLLQGDSSWIQDPETEEVMGGGGKTVDEIFAYMDEVRAHTRKVLESFDEDALGRDYPYEGDDGAKYTFSVEWVLHHLVEHEAHHRGQFMLLKRMMG